MEQPPIEPRAVSVTRLHERENENDNENDNENEMEHRMEIEMGNGVEKENGNNRGNESSIDKRIESPSLLILSDVFLDRSDVFDRLKELFTKHADDSLPPSFLFCGDFVSSNFSVDSAGIRRLLRLFTSLAELIASFPRLVEHAHFIFVPGTRDVGANGLFPREPVHRTLQIQCCRFLSSFHTQFKKYSMNIQKIFISQAIQAEFV